MIRRERDAVLANKLSNIPECLTNIARHGHAMDWTDAVHQCVILSNGEDAVQVYEQTNAERDWQVITIYGPTCRGRRALEAGRAMKSWMAPHADLIFGSVPDGLRAAAWFYRQLGGVKVDHVDSGGYRYVAQPGETLYACRIAMPENGEA